jgi:hypothetical protein
MEGTQHSHTRDRSNRVGKAGLTLQADRDSRRETGPASTDSSLRLGFALIFDSAHAAKWTELPFRALFPVLACLVIDSSSACLPIRCFDERRPLER